MVFQPGLGAVRRLVPRVMRRPVPRAVRRAMRPVGRMMRLVARLRVMGLMVRLGVRPLVARLVMRLVGRTVRRPVVVGAAMRRTGFRFFHEDDGRSGGSHAHERGEAEEEGTTADLLRLGRGVHKASPKS